MKIIDEIYELYRDKLTGDDDIDILAFAILEEFSKEDILELLNEMDEQQLFDLMGLYLIENLRSKFSKKDINEHNTNCTYETGRNLH